MTLEEQKQVDELRSEVSSANRIAEEIRAYFSSALDRSNDEARLYRGLFWSLLALTTVAAILRLIQP